MTLFEDRSTYGPDDPVETLILTIECQPGQKASIIDFLSGVVKQAGVYSVEVTHGERSLQQANPDAHPEDGAGSEANEGQSATVEPEHLWAELAGPAGEVGTGTE